MPPRIFSTGTISKVPDRLHNFAARNQSAESQIADDLYQTAVQVTEEPFLEPDIRLRAGEKILHNVAEPGAEARELYHAAGYRAPQERAVEDAVRQAGSEFQVARKI